VTRTYRPPATQRQYDVCVIGSQVGGAVAAALLARRGFRVLEIDHDGRGAGYVDGPWVLPWRPCLFPSPHLMPAAESALEEIGAAGSLARTLHPIEPGLQIFLPRHRLELPADPVARATELRREWPGDDSALEAAMHDLEALREDGGRLLASAPPLPPKGFFARLALRRAVARAPASGRGPIERCRPFEAIPGHPLAASLEALLHFLATSDGPAPPLALGRVIGSALQGLHVAEGGTQALRELFRRHGRPSGADHEESAAQRGIVESVTLGGGRLRGLRLAGSDDEHTARVFLLATEADRFARLLPAGAPSRATQALQRLRPARRLLAVNLVLGPGALPPPLGAAALLMLGDTPVLLEVQPARPREPGAADRGATHVLSAVAAVPAEPWTREAVLSGVDRIRRTLTEAIPFLDRHVVHQSVPTLVGVGDGPPNPDAADPIHEPLPGAPLGVCGLPIQGPFRNLLLASRDVLPGLGLEGEIFAGIEAAAHAASALGQKDRPGR
jgi:phytoene dehydrogenase-like protein